MVQVLANPAVSWCSSVWAGAPTDAPPFIVTLPWTSDGKRSFTVSAVAAENASAPALISVIDIVRISEMIAGSPHFVEPSPAGRPEE